jgi:hypothetical protein
VNRYRLALMSLCLGTVLSAVAQTAPQEVPKPAASMPLVSSLSSSGEPDRDAGVELPYSQPLTPPAVATGIQTPLTVGGEAERSNFISGNLQLSAGFDDNALASSSHKVSDTSYMISPGIMFAQTRSRWSWDLAYNPGFTINQHLSERNQSTHNLSTDFTVRLSPHVTFRLVDTFQKTNQLFSGITPATINAETASFQGPNEAFITPLSQFTGNVTSADLGYQFSRSSIVGVGATYYLRNYDDVAGANTSSTALVDTRSIGADAYWGHQLSNRQWFGAAFNFQRMTFPIGGETEVDRIVLFYAIPIGPGSSISLWAGPEYSSNEAIRSVLPQGGATSGRRWSPAGGVAFDWHVKHTGFRAEYSHRTTDGGGLTTAVMQQEVAVELRRQLSPRWAASAGVRYGNNDPLQQFIGSINNNRLISGSIGISRQIRSDLALEAQYGRDHQTYAYSSALTAPTDRNRAVVSLSYSFLRPLGR